MHFIISQYISFKTPKINILIVINNSKCLTPEPPEKCKLHPPHPTIIINHLASMKTNSYK